MSSSRSKHLTSTRNTDSKEDDEVHSMQFKIILLGDGAVGKVTMQAIMHDSRRLLTSDDHLLKRIIDTRLFPRVLMYLNTFLYTTSKDASD